MYKKTLNICNLQQKLSTVVKIRAGLKKRRIVLVAKTLVKRKWEI